MRVLLIQADTTQTLPMAKNLSKQGYHVDVVVSSKLTYGYGTRYANRRFIFEDYENIDEYYRFVVDIIQSSDYDLLIPMADDGAIVLSKYKQELLKYAKFVMPDFEAFENAYDKHKLMEVCQSLGIGHPRTITEPGETLDCDRIAELKFPVLIKPNHSCGARGITLANTPDELIEKYPKICKEYGPSHIQEFIPSGGRQAKVQLYIDEKGKLVEHSELIKMRWYPNNGGSSCCNQSVEDPELVHMCYKALKGTGWVGFADFDLIEDPRTRKFLIMEINPRVPACVKTAFASGVDWAKVIAYQYSGKDYKPVTTRRKVMLRHLGFETLWLLKAENRFSTKPSWFKLFGRGIYYQDMSDWTDPIPFLIGSVGNVIKQFSPSFRNAKSGI